MAERRTVIIDGRLARRRRTGAATYIRELDAALRAAAPADLDIRTVYGPPGLPRRNRLTSVGNLAIDLTWTHLLLPLTAIRRRAALIHAPFNWAPRWAPCPTVATIQDITWERVPETFPAGFRRYARLFTTMTTRHATRLITTSRSTASDLTELYGTPAARIATVPIGVHVDPNPDTGPREAFILAVGEFEPRKRIVELIEGHRAYVRDAPRDPTPCRLVIVGAGGSQEAEARRVAGPEVTFTGFASDAQLHDLYRRASLLVYPSSYEGFGLPVLEAMAHGCPALVAQNSSLVEVGGDVALPLDDPTPVGIAGALTAALADRAALALRGRASRTHAARYDWAEVARRTLDVYREAIGT